MMTFFSEKKSVETNKYIVGGGISSVCVGSVGGNGVAKKKNQFILTE